MKSYKTFLSLLALLIFVSSSSFLSTKTLNNKNSSLGGWVKLGNQTVSPGVDHDELEVTKEDRIFKRLKFKVLKSSIYIRTVTIIYGDDTSESHIITRNFKKGDASRVLDLAGHERTIKKIIFNYRSLTSGRGKTQLVVMAKT